MARAKKSEKPDGAAWQRPVAGILLSAVAVIAFLGVSSYGPRAQAKLRYRTEPVWATVSPRGEGFTLHLDEPVAGVAPGQTAVLYDDDAVVGAGVIAP